MAIDIKKHKEKLKNDEPEVKLVPFIDILFTLLIFIVVTSSFGAADVSHQATAGTGKPNITDSSGNNEYYLLPVAGLQKVTVNGIDMSNQIKDSSIGVQAQVMDSGQIVIKPQDKSVTITTPAGMDPYKAVHTPE
jgi:biopolymer transport protein ExbD